MTAGLLLSFDIEIEDTAPLGASMKTGKARHLGNNRVPDKASPWRVHPTRVLPVKH